MKKHNHSLQKEDLSGNLDTYLKKHLQEYIDFMLSQGYKLSSIVKCLKKYGYKESMLKEIIPKNKHHYRRPYYDIEELDEDTKIFLSGIIKDYIKKMEKHGYSRKDIKEALINYGHHPDIINFPARKKRNYKGIASLGSFIFYIFIVAILILELDGGFPVAPLLFAPGLLGILLSSLLKKRNIILLLNVIIVIASFVGAVYLLLYYNIDFSSYDIDIILLLNVLLSSFFSLMIMYSTEERQR